MKNKHKKTLEALFSNPVNGNIEWIKVEALFMALGAKKFEGNGSAVIFILNEGRIDFHRSHPNKETLRYRVKATREFLEKSGITT